MKTLVPSQCWNGSRVGWGVEIRLGFASYPHLIKIIIYCPQTRTTHQEMQFLAVLAFRTNASQTKK